MQDWKKLLGELASNSEQKIDDLVFRFRSRLDLFKPLHIVLYRSYGTVNRLYLKGRVLADKQIGAAQDADTIWSNLVNMYRRFESDEIQNAQVGIHFQNQHHTIFTDEEGYFVLNLEPKMPLVLDDIWHEMEVELVDAPVRFEGPVTAKAQVLVPPPDAEYGIISDIDDTIVKTGATDLLAMSRNVFLNNARTRLPFAGVSEFYRQLQLGRNGKRNNPFFYVSSSPWNMYDLLKDFLDLNEIPAGPLLLRDFGMEQNKLMHSDHMGHKFKEIENILMTYPELKFVLIGDSGQEDAPIYQAVVKKYPTRILAIYIRDVNLAERADMVVKISEEVKEHKVDMVLVENTVKAAEHAAAEGLLFTEAIPAVEADKEKDKTAAPDKLV